MGKMIVASGLALGITFLASIPTYACCANYQEFAQACINSGGDPHPAGDGADTPTCRPRSSSNDTTSDSNADGYTQLANALVDLLFGWMFRNPSPAGPDPRIAQATTLNNAGVEAFQTGNYARAVVLFGQANQLMPDVPVIQTNLQNAQARVKLQKLDTLSALSDPSAAASEQNGAGRRYVPSGNGVILGTTAIAGFNVPPGSTAQLRATEVDLLRRECSLGGCPGANTIDFEHTNFVLGIAKASEAWIDLPERVILDNLENGAFTPSLQNAYDSIKGRAFDNLSCHSNGAMICLFALQNGDITADHVVLYGPQLTAEGLHMWQGLIASGKVKSVQIDVNQNDPVPPLSLVFGDLRAQVLRLAGLPAEQSILNLPVLSRPSALAQAIQDLAPGIYVKTFPCGSKMTIDCHVLHAYQESTGQLQCPTSSATIVPGTALPGRSGVTEPPSPC
jgi:hypothetical protein